MPAAKLKKTWAEETEWNPKGKKAKANKLNTPE